jgi:pimeloyl-ACP methyl ester carboxylesterase
MGGMIAQALTVLHPADVRRLVLCATAPGNGQATGPSPAAAEALLHPDQGSGMAPLLFPPDHRAKQLPAYLAQIGQYSHPYRAPAVMARAQLSASASWISGKDPAGAGIDRIAAPTLIGGGQDDEFFPVANSTVLHKTIPRSQLVVYPDAGHGFLFQDADAWTSKIDAFLGTNG